MAIKGQKFKHYPVLIKQEAIRLHVDEGWSYSRITKHFEIHDRDRVKKWMRQYRRQGEAFFANKRGNPQQSESDPDREVGRLRLEVDILKKWLQILNREGCRVNTKSSKN